MDETPKPTPQPIVDAIQLIAAYLQQRGYSDCFIVPGGGASFHQDTTLLERLIACGDAWEAARAALTAVTAERDTMQRQADHIAAQLDIKVWEWATLSAPEVLRTRYDLLVGSLIAELRTLQIDAAERVQEAQDDD